ncbi:MAG TPA: hypothetical protein VI248_27640 [Kineosporiaceae bacterium]
MPAAAQFTRTPTAVVDPSGTALPAVAASGWRQAGLDGDVVPARGLSWSQVPVVGAGTIVIRSRVAPEAVDVFGFSALDPAGIPVERDGVQARCGQPSPAGEISCTVQPLGVSTDGARVRITTVPPRIKYLTVQATWLLDPKTDGSLPVEVSRSWIARATP